ncbi:SDR family NAD(P)-dependent oxidoreductase [Microbacterium protaetiae]|uniref:SDR family NAD(P)-dependent oxidoreductase n=1 Tax=Microbacterium protaetiae TaxID=2509458 RepID=A0A4P6ED63_9MICO|nr:oxidoreductase [Microbacterium protaetiae]QAY60185.1 SDR family NAD(P)-dependent oxidoreductase [Microbacterium protaetiae]
MPTSFDISALPDLSGKTAVVTGASSGIGRATAQALASAGARVVLAVRDPEKGRDAARSMAGQTEVRHLDLARLSSVHAFAEGWDAGGIDLLINNACAVSPTLAHTADGFELQFGTGHLGHFALSILLLPHLTGRIVTVSSQAERMGTFDGDDLAWTSGGYTQTKAYNRTKLANLLFTAELQRRLTADGSPVLAAAAHPGFVATNIYAGGSRMTKLLVTLLAQTSEQGALPVLFAAVGAVPPGGFAGPSRAGHMRGAPQLINRSKAAQDPQLAAWLWSRSEELTGVSWHAAARR